jgi:hypothetical protein
VELLRVLESIRWRQSQAARRGRPVKPGSRRLGPFTVWLNEGGLWFVATPSRYVYLDENALGWMLEATRRAINIPREPVQLAIVPDWGFSRDPGW